MQKIVSFCRPNDGTSTAIAVLPTAHQVYLALASGRHVLVTSVEQRAVLQLLSAADDSTDSVRCIAFCRASYHLAAGAGGSVVVYAPDDDGGDSLSDEPLRRWRWHAELNNGEEVCCLAWMAPRAGTPPALWVAGKTLVLWSASATGGCWERTWSREQSQPIRQIAASTVGALLATAAEDDRLVKVWHPASRAGEQIFDFCYLRHPSSVVSLEWRPPERGACDTSSDGSSGSSSASGFGLRETDAEFLLTSCANGVPRLWRMARAPEPEPLRMFLCATLTMDGSGAADDVAVSAGGGRASPSMGGSFSKVQLVQWLLPTTRPSFPPAWPPASGDGSSLSELDVSSTTRLSPSVRPPPSPLLSPGVGVPTLRPSLRERHDYLLALLDDGTLVVWLVLGLSAEPRCPPKVMVWAALPQVLPPSRRILTSSAFCNFAAPAAPPPSVRTSGALSAPMPQRAEDQLPTAISMVQHTADGGSSLRLCGVNVDRAAMASDRVHMQLLGGHGGEPIESVLPHASCSLAASRGAGGELLVWQSGAFSWQRHDEAKSARAPPKPTLQVAMRSSGGGGGGGMGGANAGGAGAGAGGGITPDLLEAPAALETSGSAPKCLLCLPGNFDAATWLSAPAATPAATRARLLAFGAGGASLFAREGRVWKCLARMAAAAFPAADLTPRDDASPAAGRAWLCVQSFASANLQTSDSREEGKGGRVVGFALRADAPRVLVWTATSDALSALGEVSLRRGPLLNLVICIAALPCARNSGGGGHGDDKWREQSNGSWEVGRLICGYSDGGVCVWSLGGTSNGADAVALHAVISRGSVLKAPVLGWEVCSLTVSAGTSPRAVAVFREPLAEATTSAARARGRGGSGARGRVTPAYRLQVLQFESSAPDPRVEFEFQVQPDEAASSTATAPAAGVRCGPPCALAALVGGAHLLAVACGSEVRLYAQCAPSLRHLPGPPESAGGVKQAEQAAEEAVDGGEKASSGPQWSLVRKLPLPDRLTCTAASWSHSGSLIVGANAVMLVWPHLLRTLEAELQPSALPQWHPASLLQQLLIEPKRCERVLEHLASAPSLASVEPLPLLQLLYAPDEQPPSVATPPAAGGGGGRGGGSADDLFAPKDTSAGLDDLFAPKASTSADLDDLFAPSSTPMDFGSILASVEEPAAPGLSKRSAAGRLKQRLQAESPCGGALQGGDVGGGGDVGNDGGDNGGAVTGAALLPRLDAASEGALVRLLRAQEVIDEAGMAVDACGGRYILYALAESSTAPAPAVPAAAVAWAVLSECHPTLLEICCRERGGDNDWASLRALGVGYWLPNGDVLRTALEAAAKVQFTKRKDPHDCALLYIGLGKKKVLQALCKAVQEQKLNTFLAHDFTEDRWRSAALKNAYSLLSKQQYELAVAFFMLGDDLSSALKVCTRQMRDIQLALVLCKLHSATVPDALMETVWRLSHPR